MDAQAMADAKAAAEKAAADKKAQKEAKAAEKAQKAATREAEKATKEVHNGVSRPKAGTKTGRIWEISDELSVGGPAPRKAVLDKAATENINPATAATQYGRWRKYNGLKGSSGATSTDTQTQAAPAA